MVHESIYYSRILDKHLNKPLVMIKNDNEEFKNSTKCRICKKIGIRKNMPHCWKI